MALWKKDCWSRFVLALGALTAWLFLRILPESLAFTDRHLESTALRKVAVVPVVGVSGLVLARLAGGSVFFPARDRFCVDRHLQTTALRKGGGLRCLSAQKRSRAVKKRRSRPLPSPRQDLTLKLQQLRVSDVTCKTSHCRSKHTCTGQECGTQSGCELTRPRNFGYVSWRFRDLARKWREDLRCGKDYLVEHGKPAECDPGSHYPCCSSENHCGSAAADCDCLDCVNYRDTLSGICANGNVIDKTQICDDTDDCGDNTDEQQNCCK
ncbi:Sortilin- receptor [Branchiostoma belcheri]|nr:Sortilin- receptor [Branchiostoma belcheri]